MNCNSPRAETLVAAVTVPASPLPQWHFFLPGLCQIHFICQMVDTHFHNSLGRVSNSDLSPELTTVSIRKYLDPLSSVSVVHATDSLFPITAF